MIFKIFKKDLKGLSRNILALAIAPYSIALRMV